jgi:hypothetical protein
MAPAQGDERLGANTSVLRQASGLYEYRQLADGQLRGREAFKLLVHPDGSRTLSVWHDLWARNAQFTVVLRVAADFRPLSAFASYWVESGYKGNTVFRVTDGELVADYSGPAGDVRQTVAVPDHFSIGTHPVAGDGWHLWYAGQAGTKGELALYSVEASAGMDQPMLGTLVNMPYKVVGPEVVETPAGRFDTTHYVLAGVNDVWVSGPDRLLVRMIAARTKTEYLLVQLQPE